MRVGESVGRSLSSVVSLLHKSFSFLFFTRKVFEMVGVSLLFTGVQCSFIHRKSVQHIYALRSIPNTHTRTHSFGRCNVIRSIMVHFMRFLVVRFSSLFYFLSRSPHHVHVWPYVVYAERFFCTVVVIVSREVARAGWKLLLSAQAIAAVSKIEDSLFCFSFSMAIRPKDPIECAHRSGGTEARERQGGSGREQCSFVCTDTSMFSSPHRQPTDQI